MYANTTNPWKDFYHGDCRSCFEVRWLDAAGICEKCNRGNSKLSLRTVNICDSCITANKISPICKRCASIVEEYAEGTTECIQCAYGKDFKPDPQYATGVCIQCKRVTHLDGDETCLSCHIINSAANAQNNDWGNLKRCGCGEVIHKKQKVCPNCASKPVNLRKDKLCHGCQTHFKPISIYDTFCIPCKENIHRGVCTSCRELSNSMDSRGWCSKCQSSNG